MNEADKIKFKVELKNFAVGQLESRLHFAQQAMLNAQEAANSEEKSSMGDKYEVGRAVGQIDSELNARQFDEANRDLLFLYNLDVSKVYDRVRDGALVVTDLQTFFVGVGLGVMKVNEISIVFLSINSPLGKVMEGNKKDATITFNGRKYLIKDIY